MAVFRRVKRLLHEDLMKQKKYSILRFICWFKTLWLTWKIAPPVGTWVDGHDYIEFETRKEETRKVQVLQCCLCGYKSEAYWRTK